MSKPYAVIAVTFPRKLDMGWWVSLCTDIPDLQASYWGDPKPLSRSAAIRRARAWSRRLGNIPVEVQE